MNAIAFQSAYAQISSPERHFVDRLVEALAEAARIAGQSIRLALSRPLPDSLRSNDRRGWLDRPLVQAAITERVLQRADADEINAARWIKEVVAIATTDITQYFKVDEMGMPEFDIEALRAAEQSGAIKSLDFDISETALGRSKVKLKVQTHDKLAALKMMAAYLGLDDGENPHRRADRAAQDTPALTDGISSADAADAYARLIGDNS